MENNDSFVILEEETTPLPKYQAATQSSSGLRSRLSSLPSSIQYVVVALLIFIFLGAVYFAFFNSPKPTISPKEYQRRAHLPQDQFVPQPQ